MKRNIKFICIIFILIVFIYQLLNYVSKSLEDINYHSTDKKYSANNIELKLPVVSATPQTCNWKRSETVHIECEDQSGSGFKSYKYAITDSMSLPSEWHENINRQEDSIVIEEDGIKYLHIIVEDNNGNISNDNVLGPYRIDRTLPTARYRLTSDEWENDEITIVVIASDERSGVKQIKLPDNNIVEAYVANYKVQQNGEYKFVIEDNVGNTYDYKVNITNIDKSIPGVTVSPDRCNWEQSIDVAINCNDTGGSNVKSYRYAITDSQSEPEEWSYDIKKVTDSITINQNGIKYLHIKVLDNAGNESNDCVFGPYYIDRIAPTASHTLDINGWTNQDVTITVTGADTQSKVKQIQLPNGQIVQGEIGNYKVEQNGSYEFVITDNVGNTYKYIVKITQIDKTNPTVTVNPINSNWAKSVTVHVECNDEGGSLFKHYQYAITDSESNPTEWSYNYTTPTGDITIEEDGIKYLHINVTDKVGNISGDKVFGPYKMDNSVPTGTVEYEVEKWSMEELNLVWQFSDDKSGFQKVILPNNEEVQESSGIYTVTENGTYNFTVYDNVGNYTVISKEVNKIDKTPPTVILTPNIDNWTEQDIVISWECIDTQSGFKEILLPDGVTSIEENGEFIAHELGKYTFVAFDNVGNKKTIEIDVRNVDKHVPDLELEADVSNWVNENVEINWKAVDHESGVKMILLPDGTETIDAQGTYIAKYNSTYMFIAYDEIGNSTVKTIEINNIDKTAPSLTLEKKEVENGTVKVHWKIQDDQSGIREILLPNGDTVTEAEGEYEITANGKYTFMVYDKVGNVENKVIEINNL